MSLLEIFFPKSRVSSCPFTINVNCPSLTWQDLVGFPYSSLLSSTAPDYLSPHAGLKTGAPGTAQSFPRVWRNTWKVAFWVMWRGRAHKSSSDGAAAQLWGCRVFQVMGLSWAGGPQKALPTFYYYSRVFSAFHNCPGCSQSLGQDSGWSGASDLAPEGWLPCNCRGCRGQLWRFSHNTCETLHIWRELLVFAAWLLWLRWVCFYDAPSGRTLWVTVDLAVALDSTCLFKLLSGEVTFLHISSEVDKFISCHWFSPPFASQAKSCHALRGSV